jgi:putative heme transporter
VLTLHPVVVLLVVTAGTVLAGLAGAFFAVPLAAAMAASGNELRLRNAAADAT